MNREKKYKKRRDNRIMKIEFCNRNGGRLGKFEWSFWTISEWKIEFCMGKWITGALKV